MKTLRFIGMALLTTVLSINLTACSDDDGGNSSSGKKLTTITWEDDNHVTRLSYDKKNRLTEVEDIFAEESGVRVRVNSFEYEDNSIIMTTTYYGDSDGADRRTVCTLNSDGYIARSVEEVYLSNRTTTTTELYTYDENNQLIKVVCTDDIETVLSWSDGNIVTIEENNYNNHYDTYTYYTYTYNSTPSSKGGIVFYDDYFIDVFSNFDLCYLANAGYFGKLPANLISETRYVRSDNHETSCQITYEYDNDGYVSNISACWGDASLSWE